MASFRAQVSTRMFQAGAAGLAAVALLGATGCTGDDVAKDEGDPKKPAGRVMKFALSDENSQALRVTVPAKPIATAPASYQGMVFELYTVKRSDKVVTVVFAMHNTTDEEIESREATRDLDEEPGQLGTDASNVSLVDTSGLKEYRSFLTGTDTDRGCLCSVVYDISAPNNFSADERQYFVTQVAAPPAEVKQVNVLAHVATIPDVKIDG